MTVNPYYLACAIVAYTRKYMGVAIIWSHEMELLTKCQFSNLKDLYDTIQKKYSENFPEHAQSQNYPEQILVGPSQIRKTIVDQLQLSSGGKTHKTQNSSNKPVSNMNVHNLLSDLKTPDKNVFDFNSVVSGNKNFT